tara:strand:- start:265 stop:543 length:279 start_codon:yes stop_codon:yes gene_type:complete
MFLKKNFSLFIFSIIIIFSSWYFFFNEKNIYTLYENIKLIKQKNEKISELNKLKKELNFKLKEFELNSEYRELIIKDKLFLKNETDKVILYD